MIYITQYGFWWSTTSTGWRSIIEYAINHDGDYDLDQMAKPLKNRPSTIRVDGSRRSGDFSYYTTRPEDQIKRPLDWDMADWEAALDEWEDAP